MNYIINYLPKDLCNIVIEYLKYSLEDRSLYIPSLIYNKLVNTFNDIKCQYIVQYSYKNKRLDIQVVIDGVNRYFTLFNKDRDEIRKWIINNEPFNTTKLKDGLDIK